MLYHFAVDLERTINKCFNIMCVTLMEMSCREQNRTDFKGISYEPHYRNTDYIKNCFVFASFFYKDIKIYM